jgi:hypothetical protein
MYFPLIKEGLKPRETLRSRWQKERLISDHLLRCGLGAAVRVFRTASRDGTRSRTALPRDWCCLPLAAITPKLQSIELEKLFERPDRE